MTLHSIKPITIMLTTARHWLTVPQHRVLRSSGVLSRWSDDFQCSARSAVWPFSQHSNLHM